MCLTEWYEDTSQEHPLQYKKSAFILVIIMASADRREYTSLLTVHCLNALDSIGAQKELSLQMMKSCLLSLCVFIILVCPSQLGFSFL